MYLCLNAAYETRLRNLSHTKHFSSFFRYYRLPLSSTVFAFVATHVPNFNGTHLFTCSPIYYLSFMPSNYLSSPFFHSGSASIWDFDFQKTTTKKKMKKERKRENEEKKNRTLFISLALHKNRWDWECVCVCVWVILFQIYNIFSCSFHLFRLSRFICVPVCACVWICSLGFTDFDEGSLLYSCDFLFYIDLVFVCIRF